MITVTAAHLTAAQDAHKRLADRQAQTEKDYRAALFNMESTRSNTRGAREEMERATEEAQHAEGIVDALAWVLGEGAPYGILSDVESEDAVTTLRRKLTGSL